MYQNDFIIAFLIPGDTPPGSYEQWDKAGVKRTSALDFLKPTRARQTLVPVFAW